MRYYEVQTPSTSVNFWVIRESFGDDIVYSGVGYISFFWAMIKLCVLKR